MSDAISFPGLGITLDPSRVAFSVFGWPVHYYGIFICLGFVLAVTYALSQFKKRKMREDDLLDFLFIGIPLSILGARLYYVLFYGGISSFLDFFKIWEGGLAVYGGVIVGVLSAMIYFKIKKLPVLKILDISAVGILIGQAIGRWGNFFNREAFGDLTDLPWRMEIFVHELSQRAAVHPTFLYESLWNGLGILLLHLRLQKKKFDGEIIIMYMGFYGLGRFFIEGLRTDSLYFFDTGIRTSQMVAAISVIAALSLLYGCYKKGFTVGGYGMEYGKIIDGKETSRVIREEILKECISLKEEGFTPGLAVILVGEDTGSLVYVANKEKACSECGFYSEVHRLPENTSEDELLGLIKELNAKESIHGILVQLPLPNGLDEKLVIESIDRKKDVDAFSYENAGRIMTGDYDMLPCTPAGIMELLKRYEIDPRAKECVVIGRSNIVGKPMAMLLMHADGTVTVAHSKTQNLKEVTKRADILVAAVGKAFFVTGDMVKEGAVVIDVGMNRDSNGKLAGDVNFEEVSKKTSFITPVPGGVGPMTITMLMKNTLTAAKKQRSEKSD